MKIHLIALLACFLVASCSDGGAMRRLDAADSLLDDRPDSALSVVRGIDAARLHTEEGRARHSLLLSLAMLKTGEISGLDSVLRPAVEYYGLSDTPSREAMLTHFAQGAASELAGNRAEAIRIYDDVFSLACGKDSVFYKGLARMHQGQIYGENFQTREELQRSIEGLYYIRKSGREDYIKDALYHMGKVYVHNDMLDRGESVLDSALSMTDAGDMAGRNRIGLLLAFIAEMKGDLKESARMTEEVINSDPEALDEDEWYSYARSLAGSGDIEKARSVMSELACPDDYAMRTSYFHTLRVMAEDEGRIVEALAWSDSAVKYSNIRVMEEQGRDILRDQHALDLEEIVFEKELSDKRKSIIVLLWTVIILGSLVLGGGMYSGWRYLKTRQRKQLEEKDREIEKIRECQEKDQDTIAALVGQLEETNMKRLHLEDKNREIEDMLRRIKAERGNVVNTEEKEKIEKEIVALEEEHRNLLVKTESLRNESCELEESLRNNFVKIHHFAVEYCAAAGVKKPGDLKKPEIAEVLRSYMSDEGMRSIERQINFSMEGLMEKLRTVKSLNEDDLKIIKLCLCGFDYKMISLITGINAKTVSGKKTRIIEKILNSKSEHIDLLKKYLEI